MQEGGRGGEVEGGREETQGGVGQGQEGLAAEVGAGREGGQGGEGDGGRVKVPGAAEGAVGEGEGVAGGEAQEGEGGGLEGHPGKWWDQEVEG